MICGVVVCLFVIGGMISAAENPKVNTNSSGRSVSDFTTPDGRIDLNAVRSAGIRGRWI